MKFLSVIASIFLGLALEFITYLSTGFGIGLTHYLDKWYWLLLYLIFCRYTVGLFYDLLGKAWGAILFVLSNKCTINKYIVGFFSLLAAFRVVVLPFSMDVHFTWMQWVAIATIFVFVGNMCASIIFAACIKKQIKDNEE